ncbi:MAG TPA: bifunctional pyr operon transcriptional regulator/uracil phosphoribosyltransferase PyrR [Lacibacter sp.]|nr:bifunctional pyr operon transcriptional regulator/uracil phosphoribosyltransferase PyrR [Lacibacter sp.]HMO90321.1 bifunctional pyr operon transcriptional regulator/uracil phosphoribosyltransferase PyrR [Lacibacter sp.]HMP87431.1 bifunctional pyr operon transcriptional regulator/uracil phosphoribosyltransferase PyrR [Lacibacter sp.]
MKTILAPDQLRLTIQRLTHQLIENHHPFSDTVFVGLQPRGVALADLIIGQIRDIYPEMAISYGQLDITFYRDDAHKQLLLASQTHLPFAIENKKVVLIDDVLYTGRTIRAAMDALIDFGRPAKVELCVLVDRRFNRQLPIQPDYAGKIIDSILEQKVTVDWSRPEVVLY